MAAFTTVIRPLQSGSFAIKFLENNLNLTIFCCKSKAKKGEQPDGKNIYCAIANYFRT